jgi:outer membrane protein assembly factor BamB
MGNVVKLKSKKTIVMAALLAVAIVAIGLFGFSCVTGLTSIGWSGGVTSNSTLYVGSAEGRLVAINMADQSRQWAEKLNPVAQTGLFGCSGIGGGCGAATPRVSIYGTPVVSGDLVYIAGYNGKIYAYNTSNLATRWVYPREGYLQPLVGGLVLAQNKLFIGGSDGWIYSFDAATGDLLNSYQTGDKIWGTPAADDNTLYIGSFDKNLYALDIDNFTLKWKFTTEGSIIAKPLLHNGTVYFGSLDRNFYAVNAADGTLKWKFPAKKWFWAGPVIIGDTIYAGCLDGFVYALKADTGLEVKEFELKSPVASSPVIVDNFIVFASYKGAIYKIDSDSQEMTLVTAIKAIINGPLTVYEGIIYINTPSILLECINLSSGAVLTPISLQS